MAGVRVQGNLNFVASFVGNFVAFVACCRLFSHRGTEAQRRGEILKFGSLAATCTEPPRQPCQRKLTVQRHLVLVLVLVLERAGTADDEARGTMERKSANGAAHPSLG